MNLSLIRSMTRSAVFELENDLCYRPAHPFIVTLNGRTVYEACNTNVFSLFSLLPGTEYTVGVQAEGESLTCTFTKMCIRDSCGTSRHQRYRTG